MTRFDFKAGGGRLCYLNSQPPPFPNQPEEETRPVFAQEHIVMILTCVVSILTSMVFICVYHRWFRYGSEWVIGPILTLYHIAWLILLDHWNHFVTTTTPNDNFSNGGDLWDFTSRLSTVQVKLVVTVIFTGLIIFCISMLYVVSMLCLYSTNKF